MSGKRAAILVLALAASLAAQAITPATVTLQAGQTQQFTVACTPSTTQRCRMNWMVDNGAWSSSGPWTVAGSIDANGLYTAPAVVNTPLTVHICGFLDGRYLLPITGIITLQPAAAPSGGTVGGLAWFFQFPAPSGPGSCIAGSIPVVDAAGYLYVCTPPPTPVLDGTGSAWIWWRSTNLFVSQW